MKEQQPTATKKAPVKSAIKSKQASIPSLYKQIIQGGENVKTEVIVTFYERCKKDKLLPHERGLSLEERLVVMKHSKRRLLTLFSKIENSKNGSCVEFVKDFFAIKLAAKLPDKNIGLTFKQRRLVNSKIPLLY